MVKAFALKTIHVCVTPGEKTDDGKGVKRAAEINVVPAGTIVDLSEDDFEEFKAVDAVRLPSKGELAELAIDEPEPTEKPKTTKSQPPAGQPPKA